MQTIESRRRWQLHRLAEALRQFGLVDRFEIRELLGGPAAPSVQQVAKRLRRFSEALPSSISPDDLAEFIVSELNRQSPGPSTEANVEGITESNRADDSETQLSLADIDAFEKIIPGPGDAHHFAKHIYRVFRGIFQSELTEESQLSNSRTEVARMNGSKRTDIMFSNTSEKGFFADLKYRHRIQAPYIHIECKNYSKDPRNPEFDQLSGRLNDRVGRFGILVCRRFRDRGGVIARARAYLSKGEYLLALEDDDILKMLRARLKADTHAINALLSQRLDELQLN